MEAEFAGCDTATTVSSVVIPELLKYNEKIYTVTSLAEGAENYGDYKGLFYGCQNVTSVTLPNSVKIIKTRAFGRCRYLNCINLGTGLEIIESCAFYECTKLTSITIPASVTSIGDSAFDSCPLTSITIPASVTSIGDSAFQSCPLTSITIPASVTNIGGAPFSNCPGITRIIVDSENGVYDSRNDCNAIIETATNVLIQGCQNTTILNTVTSIGASAFQGCTGLTSITIPASVTSIGPMAFYYCDNLATVYVKATSVPTGGNMMFSSVSSLVIYVPAGSLDAYKSATYWKDYSNKIQGKSF